MKAMTDAELLNIALDYLGPGQNSDANWILPILRSVEIIARSSRVPPIFQEPLSMCLESGPGAPAELLLALVNDDARCMALLEALHKAAIEAGGLEYGLPLHDEWYKAGLREVLYRWAASPE